MVFYLEKHKYHKSFNYFPKMTSATKLIIQPRKETGFVPPSVFDNWESACEVRETEFKCPTNHPTLFNGDKCENIKFIQENPFVHWFPQSLFKKREEAFLKLINYAGNQVLGIWIDADASTERIDELIKISHDGYKKRLGKDFPGYLVWVCFPDEMPENAILEIFDKWQKADYNRRVKNNKMRAERRSRRAAKRGAKRAAKKMKKRVDESIRASSKIFLKRLEKKEKELKKKIEEESSGDEDYYTADESSGDEGYGTANEEEHHPDDDILTWIRKQRVDKLKYR